ncbi:MAG: hypothetical protein HY817_01245 [Candidatus Abawacabacteria bacterium]|nr:hypothetical protein [Candidatus Abawacabacteria bacterium]
MSASLDHASWGLLTRAVSPGVELSPAELTELLALVREVRTELQEVTRPLSEILNPRAQISKLLGVKLIPSKHLPLPDVLHIQASDHYQELKSRTATVKVIYGPELKHGTDSIVQKVWLTMDGKSYCPAAYKVGNSDLGKEKLRRERDYAAHLIGLHNRDLDTHGLVAPLLVTRTGVFYEYIPGPESMPLNLQEAFENHSINAVAWFEIMRQLAATLDWLHSNHLMCHDLRPDNIFLNANLRGFIGDASLRHYEDIIDPHAGGFVSNPEYYDLRLVVQQQRYRDTLDIADKNAVGALLMHGLIHFGIVQAPNTQPTHPSARELYQLAKDLHEAVFHRHRHFLNKPKNGRDTQFHSWPDIARKLTVRTRKSPLVSLETR